MVLALCVRGSMALADFARNEDCSTKFQYLTSRFASLVHRSEGDRQQINVLLDELNALDYKSPMVDNQDNALLIIRKCFSIVPSNDTFLVAKGCQLISNLVSRQHVTLEGKSLSTAIAWCMESLEQCSEIAILDILAAIESLLRGNGSKVGEQIHDLMGANGALTSLLDLVKDPKKKGEGLVLASPWEVHLMTVKCFEAMVLPSDPPVEGLKSPYIETCGQVFLRQLYAEKHPEQDELLYCKVLRASLGGLQSILQQSTDLVKQLLGEALGMVKSYMLYGLHGFSDMQPQQVFPAKLSVCDIRPTEVRDGRGIKGVRVRKQNSQRQKKSGCTLNKNCEGGRGQGLSGPISTQSFHAYTLAESINNTLATEESLEASHYPFWLKTSDSDFSDVEAGQAAETRIMQSRVRKSALSLLATVTKVCERKILFGYWLSLLPDGPDMLQTSTLCTCLFKDPSSHNRVLALQILAMMLLGSRLYLLQAEKSSKNSILFTPFSVTVGNMVCELHHSLCLALATENSISVITHLLKCLAALIQNTPYHRLEPGLITKLVESVQSYLNHKDSSVQVASLTVLGSIVAIEPGTSEITDILCKSSITSGQKDHHNVFMSESEHKIFGESAVDKEQQHDSNKECDYDEVPEDNADVHLEHTRTDVNYQMSWLLEICIRNLEHPSVPEIIRRRVDGNARLLPCLAPVRVESLQVLTVLARNYFTLVMNSHLGQLMQLLDWTLNDGDVTISLHSGRVIEALGNSMKQCLQEGGVSLDESLQFWQTVLSGPLMSLVQNVGQAALRAVGCDCLAAIGAEVLEQLPHDRQTLIITSLFRCSHDEDIIVRSSAVRALATYILFPALRKDIHFVIDTAKCTIRTVQDESLLVRMKAAWSLGNLSESLVLNSLDDDMEDIPRELILKLMETSTKAANDNDKVRSCAVRAVGNFIRLVTEDMMKDRNFRECSNKAIAVMVQNTTGKNMKVRWNACYAIGNMMRNNALYLDSSAWQNTVFITLTKLVQDVPNFKVRIHAALALSVPSSREQYGSFYIVTWIALLNGLDNSENMEDFSEYKHRDNLLDQICLTLGHMTTLATKDDLALLHDALVFHLDTLKHHLLKFHERVVPEKAEVLAAATNHATYLLQLPDLTFIQHSAAALLVSMFLQDSDLSFAA